MERERGLTLVELVVVIAFIGALSAVSVPLGYNFLGGPKEQSYETERRKIQAAVDVFYSAQENIRFNGKRQYPLIGRGQTVQASLTTVASTSVVSLTDQGDPFNLSADIDGDASPDTAFWNPLGGTQGADLATTTAWTEGGDGVRTIDSASSDTWKTVSVQFDDVTYQVDPRYHFIDFEVLVERGYLLALPESASQDNRPSGSSLAYTGSYSWYVNHEGKVQSVYFYYADQTGAVDGVFP